jgi:hypothetical protein
MLNEDNITIEKALEDLNNKIRRLRKLGYLSIKVLKKLSQISEETIIPWMEGYYFDTEFSLTRKEEEEFINMILDINNDLDRIEKDHESK